MRQDLAAIIQDIVTLHCVSEGVSVSVHPLMVAPLLWLNQQCLKNLTYNSSEVAIGLSLQVVITGATSQDMLLPLCGASLQCTTLNTGIYTNYLTKELVHVIVRLQRYSEVTGDNAYLGNTTGTVLKEAPSLSPWCA